MNNDRNFVEGMGVFLETLSVGPAEAILRQEKRGQETIVNSSKLPSNLRGDTREQYEKMGIVFGEKADELFVHVTLPEGWKIVATDHSMWNKLLDEQGRERATFFYKAAFYDRSAFMSLTRRYNYRPEPKVKHEYGGIYIATLMDQGQPIADAPVLEATNHDKVCKLAKAWLADHFPDWEDATAYWN